MSLEDLPALNACLNSAACLLLLLGYRAIKRGYRQRHRNLMVCALVVSALFLTSYLTYHFHFGHKVFPELGWIKSLYLAILIPHVILAVVMVPFILLHLLLCLFSAVGAASLAGSYHAAHLVGGFGIGDCGLWFLGAFLFLILS